MKKEVYKVDINSLETRPVIMYAEVVNNIEDFSAILTRLYKQEYALMEEMSYWEFEDEETEMYDNHLRIYALLAEYIDYAKQINYDDIIDKAYELSLEDISTTDETE